jgi:hypothetical protein
MTSLSWFRAYAACLDCQSAHFPLVQVCVCVLVQVCVCYVSVLCLCACIFEYICYHIPTYIYISYFTFRIDMYAYKETEAECIGIHIRRRRR